MNGVIATFIIALCIILTFFWVPFVGLIYEGNLDLGQPLRIPDNSVNIEYVTGYAADLNTINTVAITNPSPGSQNLGAVSFRMSLDSYRTLGIRDMSVDLDKTIITFTDKNGSETLQQQSGGSLTKPGWSIIEKTGLLPFQSNDQDNILEPYESFKILVLPSTPLPPMSRFLVLLQMPDNRQAFFSRAVPETIIPVMSLN